MANPPRLLPSVLTSTYVAVAVAVLAPLAATAVLVPFRDNIANTNAALILVLVIVAVSTSATRIAGVLAALSAAIWFDLFLTQPYERLTITDRGDLETTALLLAVGVGVSELAAWGYRQQEMAIRDAGYLDGIRTAASIAATGSSPGALIDSISSQLIQVLGLRSCRFEYGVAGLGHPARLHDDGEVELHRELWDVEGKGLPTDVEIEILVENKGRLLGRFLLSAAPGSHPALAQRRVALTLADQVGASLS